MATNSEHKTESITIQKTTVKTINKLDKNEFPRAEKKDGRYVLPWETDAVAPDGWSQFKSFFTADNSRVPSSEEKLNEEPLMQLMKPDPQRILNPPENGIRTTWLGHNSVFFQFDGVNILVNPNFNARGIKYYHPGDNKRYRPPVYTVDQLPRVDCVFITNTHFDYLDLSSVRQLNDRFGELLLWYVPMGVRLWMEKAGCSNVVEMDWWKEDEVEFIDHTNIDDEEETKTTLFNIACTPSQNYHDRTFDDDNEVLWCSWVIRSPRYRIFVSGATGYAKVFESIGRRYGPFHMAALPIGGYDPSWKYAYGNLTPEQAVQVHKDVLAMCSLALSWGTFTIGNEYYLEPPQRLNDELRKSGLSEMQFFLLKHGESRLIEIKEADKEDEAPQENGDCNGHEEESAPPAEDVKHHDDESSEEQKQEDADLLQQLCDNFVDETQPEAEQVEGNVEGDASIHVNVSLG